MVIAIDGPGGSGKSTIAKLLAKRLSISYLDTGATYRVLTLKCLQENVDFNNLLEVSSYVRNLSIEFIEDKVFLDGEDVTYKIRTPLIDKTVSLVASNPYAREELVYLQRKIVNNKSFVVEGRDITTVVFPHAEYKFYLDASLEERARRRYNQIKDIIKNLTLEEVQEDIKRRDEKDMSRKVSPLKIADDAVYIDTTNLTIEEVLEKILSYIKI